MVETVDALAKLVGAEHVLAGGAAADGSVADYTHDECLTVAPVAPAAVVKPGSAEEVAAVVRWAAEHGVGITARGSATGLSGGCIPDPGGIVVSFERMNAIVDIDTANHVAVVQPGVTLRQLDEATAVHGLIYPVFPGESSASLGGTVATNAGGMRAIRYGVTRHHVLGLQAVLASGQIVRTGGKVVKSSSGYDLTQLLVGSEGTLALITEATLKLHPRLAQRATVLAPFATLAQVTAAVPRIVDAGLGPLMLEYIDTLTMAAATEAAGLDLGIPAEVRDRTLAYLVVALEGAHDDRLQADVEVCGELLGALDAIDVYVLPPSAADELIKARERAFFVAKAAGADDIVDVVVPRAAVPRFLAEVAELGAEHGALVAGCGHAGDGNVHLSIFQPDAERRQRLLRAVFAAGVALGGAISGEHGLGRAKQSYFVELEDPVKLQLLRAIKQAFDPQGVLAPGLALPAPAQAASAQAAPAQAASAQAGAGAVPGGAA